MNFFKKYGVALLVTILLIVAAVWIGVDKGGPAINRSYYRQWVIDEANLLSEETEDKLAVMNESLDKKYGSVVGLITVENLNGTAIADAVYAAANDYGYGSNDLVIMIAPTESAWYMAYGDTISQYTNNELRLATIGHMTDEVYTQADASVLSLYESLSDWYRTAVPKGSGNYGRHRALRGSDVVVGFLSLILGLGILLTMVRYLFYPLFRYSTLGGWYPLWGWSLFGPFRFRPWFFHHHRHHTPPPPGGFGGAQNFGRGFGGNGRGGFGNGGGFGNRSR